MTDHSDTNNAHSAAIREELNMTRDEDQSFDTYMLGSLSVLVDPATWSRALNTARSCTIQRRAR